jgi:Homeodomain-like domain
MTYPPAVNGKAAEGRPSSAADLSVRATRRRYLADGMRAMKDRPRPGRALVYDIDARLLVIATATSEPGGPETAWTHAGIAAHLAAEHQIPVSASQAGRILAEADIRPHLVRGWLNRKDDPAFFGKARAICGLYRNPPPGAVLLSIDEKTGIQARSRKHPARRARPGHRERRESGYVRHGTVSLMAAMNVVTGQVPGEIITRNDPAAFCAFLALIGQAIPLELRRPPVQGRMTPGKAGVALRWRHEPRRGITSHRHVSERMASWQHGERSSGTYRSSRRGYVTVLTRARTRPSPPCAGTARPASALRS